MTGVQTCALPICKAQLLLVEDGGRLLFERRPPAGIWGGLWCLPIAEAGEDPGAALRDRYGLRARAVGVLPVISHGFTHFDLKLTPLRLRVAGRVPALAERQDLRWINIAQDSLPGLPAPVAKLLGRLRTTPGE